MKPKLFQIKNNSLMSWTFLLGLVALVDTVYISLEHFIPGPPPDFAFTFGIPTAPIGIIFYIAIILLNGFYLRTKIESLLNVLLVFLFLGFLMGINTIYTQGFVLKFFCPYAYGYVILSILMFVFAILYKFKKR